MLEDLVELLDRQWSFLLKQEGAEFHRQLRRFVRFVQEEPRLNAFIDDMQRDGEELIAQHLQYDQISTQLIVALRNEFAKQLPAEDDSLMPVPDTNPLAIEYEWSFAKFDKVANKPSDNLVRVDTLADNTRAKTLLRIMESKFKELEDNRIKQATTGADDRQIGMDELQSRLVYLREQHQYTHRNFVDKKLTSAGLLFKGVLQLLRDLNTEPTPPPADRQEREAQVLASVNRYFNEGLAVLGKRDLERALYKEQALSTDESEAIEQSTQKLKLYMERVYEDLRLRIGARRSLLGLVSRFKHRCEWHDRAYLYNLARGSKRRVEEALTAELALWFFDQGFSPVSKPMMAGLQPDLTDSSLKKFSLYVEAKQYGSGAKTKRYLIKGFHQLWDTVSGLKGTPYEVKEAFYIIFKCGGPRYTLPTEPLPGEGWTAHIRLIDIAPSKERGSQGAKQPIEILKDELIPARSGKSARSLPARRAGRQARGKGRQVVTRRPKSSE